MNNYANSFQRQQGLTLIELLLALLLGLILSAAALMMFISNKETSTLQTEFSRVQENGRFATDLLMRAIRPAGYWGCATNTAKTLNTLNGGHTGAYDFDRGVEGFDANTSGGWDANTDTTSITVSSGGLTMTDADGNTSTVFSSVSGSTMVTGSDILFIKTIGGAGCSVLDNPGAGGGGGVCKCNFDCGGGPNSANIKTNSGCSIEEDDILMVSDCQDSVIFQVTTPPSSGSGQITVGVNTGTGTIGNCTSKWGKSHEGSMVFQATSYAFMVRQRTDGVRSLYRWRNGTLSEMVEGIEEMQLLYGEGNNGIVTDYVTADSVTDWDNVYSVRLMLLARSSRQNILDVQQTISLDTNNDGDVDDTGESITTTDMRIRQVFQTTVVIRNKLS